MATPPLFWGSTKSGEKTTGELSRQGSSEAFGMFQTTGTESCESLGSLYNFLNDSNSGPIHLPIQHVRVYKPTIVHVPEGTYMEGYTARIEHTDRFSHFFGSDDDDDDDKATTSTECMSPFSTFGFVSTYNNNNNNNNNNIGSKNTRSDHVDSGWDWRVVEEKAPPAIHNISRLGVSNSDAPAGKRKTSALVRKPNFNSADLLSIQQTKSDRLIEHFEPPSPGTSPKQRPDEPPFPHYTLQGAERLAIVRRGLYLPRDASFMQVRTLLSRNPLVILYLSTGELPYPVFALPSHLPEQAAMSRRHTEAECYNLLQTISEIWWADSGIHSVLEKAIGKLS